MEKYIIFPPHSHIEYILFMNDLIWQDIFGGEQDTIFHEGISNDTIFIIRLCAIVAC